MLATLRRRPAPCRVGSERQAGRGKGAPPGAEAGATSAADSSAPKHRAVATTGPGHGQLCRPSVSKVRRGKVPGFLGIPPGKGPSLKARASLKVLRAKSMLSINAKRRGHLLRLSVAGHNAGHVQSLWAELCP